MCPEFQLQTVEENLTSTITFHVQAVFFFKNEEQLVHIKLDVNVTGDVFTPFSGS